MGVQVGGGCERVGRGRPDEVSLQRAAFEQGSGLRVLLDPDLNILMASDAYLEASMTTREQVVGLYLFDVFPDNPDDPTADGSAKVRASLDRVRARLLPDAMPVQRYDVRRPAGEGGGFEGRWWSPLNSPVLDDRGHLVGILHQVEDVTELVRLRSTIGDDATEAPTERDTASVEELLFRRTKELEAAMSRLQELDRLKSEFLARMSHELRTPLNAVIGFAQLLESDVEEERRVHAVQQVLSSGRHLLDLINEVLDITQIETGKLNLSIEPVAVDEAVRAAVAFVEPIADERGISVALPDRDPDRYVRADRQRLLQVLLNLLSNAVKYNRPEGRIWVTVDEVGDRVRIGVRDTGPGIAEDERAGLFAPFDRLGKERTDIEGSGVGLMLARGLAEHMGCGLELAESGPNGSTFVLDVPSEAPTAPPSASVRAGDIPGPRPLGSIGADQPVVRVLHIEDNHSNIELMEAILDRVPNVELRTATQGRLGFELAVEHGPDLILLDVHLPDLDGDEVLALLRAHPSTASTRVVFLSADATPRRAEQLLEAGADGYLTKPFDLDQLLDVVEAARSSVPA